VRESSSSQRRSCFTYKEGEGCLLLTVKGNGANRGALLLRIDCPEESERYRNLL